MIPKVDTLIERKKSKKVMVVGWVWMDHQNTKMIKNVQNQILKKKPLFGVLFLERLN